MHHRLKATAVVSGALLALGALAAPTANATTPDLQLNPTHTDQTRYSWRTVDPALAPQFSIGSNTTTLHVILPAELSTGLEGASYKWTGLGGGAPETIAGSTVPAGVSEFDMNVPSFNGFAAFDAGGYKLVINNGSALSCAGGYCTVDHNQTELTAYVDVGSAPRTATVDLDLSHSPGGLSVGGYDRGLWSRSTFYRVGFEADQPSIYAGDPVTVHAQAGFFTTGPDGAWSGSHVGVGFSTSGCVTCGTIQLPGATVSADGSALTFTAPATLPDGRDVSKDGISIGVTGIGTNHTVYVVIKPNLQIPGAFTNDVAPVVSGTAQVGQTLTVATGTWTPVASTTAIQWLRNGTAIPGATQGTYVPTAADLGKQLRARVTVTATGFITQSATPAATAAVAAGVAPKATTRATVTGVTKVGKKLTAHVGVWSPKPTGYGYQWLRDGKVIKAATRSTYVLKAADRGHKVSVKVTAHRAGHLDGTSTSKAARIT